MLNNRRRLDIAGLIFSKTFAAHLEFLKVFRHKAQKANFLWDRDLQFRSPGIEHLDYSSAKVFDLKKHLHLQILYRFLFFVVLFDKVLSSGSLSYQLNSFSI